MSPSNTNQTGMEILRPDFLPVTVILISRFRERRSLRPSFRVGIGNSRIQLSAHVSKSVDRIYFSLPIKDDNVVHFVLLLTLALERARARFSVLGNLAGDDSRDFGILFLNHLRRMGIEPLD